MYNLSSYYDIPDFKPFDCKEKVKEFIALLKYPEVQAVLKLIIDSSIATSDLQILQRLAAVETVLGLDDFSEEDSKPTIPEQLSLLAERIDNITESVTSQDPVKPVVNTNPKTTLEHKASELVEHLKTNVKPRNGEVFLNTREIIHFLKYEISEEYRIKDIQNPRQVKKAVIEKARKLFPDTITLSQKKHGTKDVRIVYKAYGYIHTPEK